MGRRNTSEEVFRITGEAQVNELSAVVDRLGDIEGAIRDVDGAGQSSSRAMDTAGGGFERLVGFANIATGAIIGLDAALGGLNLAADLVGGILSASEATNLLEAQTGLTGDALQELVDIGDEIFKGNWGDSLGDVHDAMQRVRNITQLEGEELQALAIHAIAVRDIFDADIPESVRAADTVMEQFGVDGEHAFDLITAGFQRTGDPADDFLDTLNEYSGNFAEMGFSAQEFLEILQGGLAAGARNTDDLADAVREFQIRLNDASAAEALAALGLEEMYAAYTRGDATGAELFNETITALEGVSNEQGRAMLAAGLFGTRAEDVGIQVVTGMNDALGATEDVTGAMENAEAAVSRGLGPAIESFKRTAGIELTRALEPTIIAISEDLQPALVDFADWMETDGGPAIQEFAGWLQNDAVPAVADFAETMNNDVLPVLEFIATGFGPIIEHGRLVVEVFGAIADAAGAIGDVAGFVGGLIPGGGDDGGSQYNTVEGGLATFSDDFIARATGDGGGSLQIGISEERIEELDTQLNEVIEKEREMSADYSWVDDFDAALNAATADRSVDVSINLLLSGGVPDVALNDVGMSVSGMSLPGRAAGGPVMPFGTYLVGEEGPELLQMGSRGGHVIPNAGGPRLIQVVLPGVGVIAEALDDHYADQGY